MPKFSDNIKKFPVLLFKEDYERLKKLKQTTGVSISYWIRSLVHEALKNNKEV